DSTAAAALPGRAPAAVSMLRIMFVAFSPSNPMYAKLAAREFRTPTPTDDRENSSLIEATMAFACPASPYMPVKLARASLIAVEVLKTPLTNWPIPIAPSAVAPIAPRLRSDAPMPPIPEDASDAPCVSDAIPDRTRENALSPAERTSLNAVPAPDW